MCRFYEFSTDTGAVFMSCLLRHMALMSCLYRDMCRFYEFSTETGVAIMSCLFRHMVFMSCLLRHMALMSCLLRHVLFLWLAYWDTWFLWVAYWDRCYFMTATLRKTQQYHKYLPPLLLFVVIADTSQDVQVLISTFWLTVQNIR